MMQRRTLSSPSLLFQAGREVRKESSYQQPLVPTLHRFHGRFVTTRRVVAVDDFILHDTDSPPVGVEAGEGRKAVQGRTSSQKGTF